MKTWLLIFGFGFCALFTLLFGYRVVSAMDKNNTKSLHTNLVGDSVYLVTTQCGDTVEEVIADSYDIDESGNLIFKNVSAFATQHPKSYAYGYWSKVEAKTN